ncbi:MAG: M23 family metallopeptidase [Proteobacteria bacterium]|nr:M23 family metallopeptidase [Pseudomonadota bacterium]
MSYRRKKQFLSPAKLGVALGIVLVAAVILVWIKSPYLRSVFDRTPPRLAIDDGASAPGALPTLAITAEDASGVSALEVAFMQGDRRKALTPQLSTSATGVVTAVVTIPGTADGFADGKGVLEVNATAAGIWGTKSSSKKEVLVDSRPPRIEVLSLQHVVAQGGSELVLVKARDENLSGVGAAVAGIRFPAFRLAEVDPFFANLPEYYGILFALPLEFDPDRDKVEVVAADMAGNTRSVALSFRIARARKVEVAPKLTVAFLRKKLPELLESYARMTQQAVPTESELQTADAATLVQNFRLVNQTYRAYLQDRLKQLLSGVMSAKRWSGDFLKPMSSSTTSIFGERRAYTLDGQDAGSSIHYGLDLASVANDSVRASSAGTVLFSGEFGIYGETVIVDHGLGLTSLYGHLASTSVATGDELSAGAEVGRSGQTGLAGGDHLHFEYRLHNIPVTPIEWWDPKWVRDHFSGKIEGLKVSLAAAAKL